MGRPIGSKNKPKADADEPKIGHNSGMLNDDLKRQLSGIVAEVEWENAEADKIKEAIKEIYTAADEKGFDCKAIRAIVRDRKIDRFKREEMESVMDCYRHALGMLGELGGTPLGDAALQREFPSVNSVVDKLAPADTPAMPDVVPDSHPW
jgi:uncharacterized protein (UPF0335 family)